MTVLGQRHLAGGALGEPSAQLELDEAITNNPTLGDPGDAPLR
jgi:hypothetical protein